MKKEYIFATNNKNKLKEINQIAKDKIKILSPLDLGFAGEIPEDKFSLEENSLQKARYIYDKFKTSCFADDTGLEVEALNGAPGVFSARYAGEEKDSEKNMIKLLSELEGCENRNARFRTAFALIINDKEYVFEGIVNGVIIKEKKGINGFGYDPVFIPDGYDKTFAELPLEEKNKISHRGLAIKKLLNFLDTLEK